MIFKSENIDWHSASLSLDTKIDPAFKLTQNVRRFLKLHLGEYHLIDRSFMHYLKTNNGITFRGAINYRKRHLNK